ncbi:GNAT family N-acetyltransferase [Cellulomonas sp. zg-ZUI222]|uniref:GNAT family N-acetyltransferase n=1 Tax=Cellulomonas wangleii TaxID=2816956 RepID=A0ABX8D9J7_9CELL|nr:MULTISPECIES: GNAT family N-acetyltransferase [Cellulomonas]MBO0900686.1 GNAT family N-acetyltransferase [Cellulomonas sp. zg-ZUI22]MBO0921354.1 GNAT family N-acetyltransferase [Cellulomonas wangleii]MBO0925770.1 GNAT family N-acetyltransferase [Cellulomonas wangleii]QVI63708.1 GNAT family N-acetyltransferase [Cellulomonas wangleii]
MLPTADVSVRPAVPGDEERIARIQLAAWRASHVDVLGEVVLDSLDEQAFVERWRQAVTAPPGPGYHVLVACDGPRVVGVASVAPVAPPDPMQAPGGVVLALEVDPPDQRAGHGSRLLAAAVDLLRADGADQVQTWVVEGDAARERFLSGAGLGPDGRSRRLATGPGPDEEAHVVTERRWYAGI